MKWGKCRFWNDCFLLLIKQYIFYNNTKLEIQGLDWTDQSGREEMLVMNEKQSKRNIKDIRDERNKL